MYVVTGGGRGIGKSLALALASRGKSVFIIGRNTQPLKEITSTNPNIQSLTADISTEAGRKLIASKLSTYSNLDGLIHNAGIIEPFVHIEKVDITEWRQNLATNLEAPLFLTQLLYTKLTKSKVLMIGSGAAYIPVAGWGTYCVSKAALSMLTRCWQLEASDVYFASVMPGIIDTQMQAKIRQAPYMDQSKQDFFIQLKDQRKLLHPDTVGLFLTWLLLEVEPSVYCSKEWDIYDQSHHSAWLKPPHVVPSWEA